ncbi:MAG TPA: phosphatidate cytidylyltransferase [Burkholderiales bacterium]|nr:phosphatidate cytidylyltransferase [Burkholderiales bacterium]
MRSPEGLARRVVTALALLGVFLAILFLLDARVLALAVAGVLGLAAHEWTRLAGVSAGAASAWGGSFAVLFAAVALTSPADAPWRTPLFLAAAAFWVIAAPVWLAARAGRAPRGVLVACGAALLASAGLAALSISPLTLFLALGLVWIADTAAYFAGNAFGRRRLAPSLSPGKTWEGVAGAVAATLAYAIIFAMPGAPLEGYARQAGWPAYLAAAVLLCAVSIVGDLFESALKRQAGAKDSGTLLPGHGGVLDRLDSALAALPVAAALLHGISTA